MTFSPSYTTPYSTAEEQAVEIGAFGVLVDGRGFITDTASNTPYNETWHRSSIDLLNSQQNPQEEGASLLPPEVWRRSQVSWHHGCGQNVADRKDSDPYRFDTSKGVNVWNKYQLTLLNETSLAQADTGKIVGVVVNNIAIVAMGADLYMFRDTPLDLAEQWEVGAISPATYKLTTTLSGDAVDAATDGKYAFFVVGTTLYRVAATYGATTVTTVTLPITASMIEFVNGYMVAGVDGDAGVLYDISPITAAEPMAIGSWTTASGKIGQTITAVNWVGAASGKNSMFFLGGRSDNWGVYAVTITPSTTTATLSAPFRVADLPVGERGKALFSYLGYLLIGTSRGVRFATGDDAKIVYGPLLDIDRPVTCFEADDRFVWFGWSDYGGTSGLGRIDLSEFVADLQPAYASDLMVSASGNTEWVGSIYGRMLFGVRDSGVWRQTDNLVESGTLSCSKWTFGVVDRKTAFYVQATTLPLEGSIEVSADLDDSPVIAGADSSSGTVTHRFDMSGQQFSVMQAGVELMRDTATTGPTVKEIEGRSTYIRGKAAEWRVPLLIRDAIELYDSQVESRDVTDDYEFLIDLYQSGRPFTYSEGDLSWRVFTTGFIWTPTEPSHSKSGWQGVFTLVFREVK